MRGGPFSEAVWIILVVVLVVAVVIPRTIEWILTASNNRSYPDKKEDKPKPKSGIKPAKNASERTIKRSKLP